MQQWQYARLTLRLEKENVFQSKGYTVSLLADSATTTRNVEEKQVKGDYLDAFDREVAHMGDLGWELVSVAPRAAAVWAKFVPTVEWHLWFKRPTEPGAS